MPSAPTVTKPAPFALTAIPVTAPSWALERAGRFAVGRPQEYFSVGRPGRDRGAVRPQGDGRHRGRRPVNSRVSWPLPTFESFTDLSAPPVSTLLSVGGESEHVDRVRVGRQTACGAGTGNCQIFHKPSSPTE